MIYDVTASKPGHQGGNKWGLVEWTIPQQADKPGNRHFNVSLDSLIHLITEKYLHTFDH